MIFLGICYILSCAGYMSAIHQSQYNSLGILYFVHRASCYDSW